MDNYNYERTQYGPWAIIEREWPYRNDAHPNRRRFAREIIASQISHIRLHRRFMAGGII